MNRITVSLMPGYRNSPAQVNGNDVATLGHDVRTMLDAEIDTLQLIDTPPYRSREFVSRELFSEVVAALEESYRLLSIAYQADEDPFGISHNDACDSLGVSEVVLARAKEVKAV